MSKGDVFSGDRLSSITTDTAMLYEFLYNGIGQRTSLSVGTSGNMATLASYTYNSRNLTSRLTYGNGVYADYTYDDLDRLIKTRYNNNESDKTEYTYDNSGRVTRVANSSSGYTSLYSYDMAGRVREFLRTGTTSAGTQRFRVNYCYEDGTNRLSSYSRTTLTNGVNAYRNETTELIYGNTASGQMADVVYGVKHGTSSTAGQGTLTQRLAYAYDGFGRLTTRTLSAISKTTSYTYVTNGTNGRTTVVASMQNGSETLSYSYDNNGNITEYHKGGSLQEKYYYDALNQLYRVNSVVQDKTIVYAYDDNGNILSKTEYTYTTGTPSNQLALIEYGYNNTIGWKDRLMSYNGQSISYDGLGNPLTYRGMTFTPSHRM